MVVGSIIATGEERGEGGGGGKEDIHVLLTEWRCKNKDACKDKGQGMETNPLHALRTCVYMARCTPHAHKQHLLSHQSPRMCTGHCPGKRKGGTPGELGQLLGSEGFYDWVKNFCHTNGMLNNWLILLVLLFGCMTGRELKE